MPPSTNHHPNRNINSANYWGVSSSVVDAWLSKAIRRVVFVSLVVHLLLLVKNSSKSTGRWLESIAAFQDLEDFPTMSFWGEATHEVLERNNDTHYLNASDAATSKNGTRKQQQLLSSADIRAPRTTHRIPLEELIHSSPNVTCNPGKSKKYLIDSTINLSENSHNNSSSRRKIPKIVHVTSKTRCMTPTFIRNIDKWRFPGYSLLFHDDAAVDRLLAKYWPEFPQLQLFQKCSISGAAKADIWRLLVLWEYGGIYTDIDNAPGPKFDNGNIIQDDDDAWFVVERVGVLSQYFMAASPKHPLIHVALTSLFQRLLEVENIRKQYVPFVTGPGAMKVAMMNFMKDGKKLFKKGVKRGKYIGVAGRSVTVVGSKGKATEYVRRESVSGIDKRGGYVAMGMQHFSGKKGRDQAPTSSCYEHLYKETKKLVNEQRLQAEKDWQSSTTATTMT